MIIEPIQIPEGVTLTIDKGVEIGCATDQMFIVHGRLVATGTDSEPIIINANDCDLFVGLYAPRDMEVIFTYGVINDARSIWPTTHANYGALTFEDNVVNGSTTYSYVWYPWRAISIRRNIFIDSAGWFSGSAVIENNRFESKSAGNDYWILNWQSKTIVRHNSFLDGGNAIEIGEGYSQTGVDARDNYWGTQSESEIRDRNLDSDDEISRRGEVLFLPVLQSPHALTP